MARSTITDINEAWQQYKAEPSKRLKDELIVHYMPLVGAISRKMLEGYPPHIEYQDFVSYGVFGLMTAIDRFEPERGFKFETFAAQRIKGAIVDTLRSQEWIPRTIIARRRLLAGHYSRLEQELCRPPTDEELSEATQVPLDDVRDAAVQVWIHNPMDAGSSTTGTDNGIQRDESADSFALQDLVEGLASAIEELSERERVVVTLYYHEGLTLAEIALVLGVTESRICQVHSKAILSVERLVRGLSSSNSDEPDRKSKHRA